jgi:class 3 adenylate cyclase
VNVASRLQAQATPGRVHVSEATRLLLGERFEFEAEGERELRGHTPMRTYAVTGADADRRATKTARRTP